MENTDILHALKLCLVCIFWYASGASGNVIGKLVLNEFPYPMTMTMVQLSSAALYLGPILTMLGVPRSAGEISRSYYMKMIVPLALGKFVSSVSSHISIWKVSVSYAHTVKATLPLFTVIFLRLFFKEKQALPALKDTGIHYMNLLLTLSRLSTLCFLPFWLVLDLTRIVSDPNVVEHDNKLFAVFLIWLDGVCNMLQNVFAFTVLAMVNPLSYAVANATKRVVIIGASLMFLHNPVTGTNVFGMMVAVFGVFLYNWAKQHQRIQESRQKVLPYIHSTTDMKQFAHHKETLPHSKTLSNLNQNGAIRNNVFLENLNDYGSGMLIPVPEDPYVKRKKREDLHARGPHIFDV